uniref:Uncharacterized protein n=1 Tax=viral metagenome TaxID=1070528 RepID=A0A6C0AE39_9ZZZZ
MSRDIEYEENRSIKGIKCKNYILCDTVLPDWWFDCKVCYLCTHCHMSFGSWKSGETEKKGKGELAQHENVECIICLENKLCVEQPCCDHKICVNCFKRCYYGEDIESLGLEVP